MFFVLFFFVLHSVIFKKETEDKFKKEETNKEDEDFEKKGKTFRNKHGSWKSLFSRDDFQ